MQARDIMTTTVVTVTPETTIQDVAKLLLDNRISAVPVVDKEGHLLGILSEGDLIRRPENQTTGRASWWLRLLASPEEKAFAYVKSHGGHAGDVMTRKVVSVDENATLEHIASTLEQHRIKRVPVLQGRKLVGLVSRANLLHGLIAGKAAPVEPATDPALRTAVEVAVADAGVRTGLLSIVVSGGIVHMWGAVESHSEKQAARIAAEGVPGVAGVKDEIGVLPANVRSFMWAQ